MVLFNIINVDKLMFIFKEEVFWLIYLKYLK